MPKVIDGGGLMVKDPDSERVISFDWDGDLAADAEIADSEFIISGADADLTFDNDDVAADGRSASLRLIGGTLGLTYILTHRIVTNETPTQTDDESIEVLIQQT